MRIKQLMTSDVATCRPDSNLAVVAQLMWDRDCGLVPVVDATGKVVGVITDRDVCIAAATRRLAPEQITAAQAMSHQPIHTIRPDDRVEQALAMMKRFQVRRLPVVGADRALKGIVSLNDLVLATQGVVATQGGLATQAKDGPTAADILNTLAAICAHRPAKVSAA